MLLRRAIVVGLTLSFAFLLLLLQNKVFVGEQSLKAELGPKTNGSYQVIFRDISGVLCT